MATLTPPASMVARWCADDLTAAHGTSVSAWTDQVSAKVLAQTTANNQPLLFKGTFGINGHSVVKFDGANDYLSVLSFASIDIETLTMFVLLRETTLTASKVIVGKQDSAHITPQPWSLITPATAANVEFRASDGTNTPIATDTGLVANTAYVVTGARTKNATVRIYRNGAQVASTADTAIGTTPNGARLSVGGRANTNGTSAGAAFTAAHIAEIIVCNDDNAATRHVIHSFFQDQYGVTVADYIYPPTIAYTQTAVRTFDFTTSVAGQAGALAFSLVRLSGPAATITETSEGVFDVAYIRPLASQILLEVTVVETGGLTATAQVALSPEASFARLVSQSGAWV